MFSDEELRTIYRTLKSVKIQAEKLADKIKYNTGLKMDIEEYKKLMDKIEGLLTKVAND